MTNPNYTDITIVLDRSGSMQSVATDTIGGFNTFLSDQQKLPGKAILTLVQFDHEYEVVHDAKPLDAIPALTAQTFVPRGNTALLDATGRSITAAGVRFSNMPEQERPGKVLFVILTDGHENASREFTRQKIAEMIKLQRESFNWQFLFLGANIDAVSVAQTYNIPQASAIRYAANTVGTQHAFASVSMSTANYRSATVGDAKAAFTDEDRQKQSSAGA